MSKDDLVDQFCSIVNTSDVTLARNMLESSNWDLNEAIFKHFNGCSVSISRGNRIYSLLALLKDYYKTIYRFLTSWLPFFSETSFDKYFVSTYGNTSVHFYKGSFIEASEHAATAAKPLIIYLHYEKSENTYEFCKGILCNKQIEDILYGEYVFWAQNVDSAEGRRVRRLCGANNYPHISIFAFENNNPIKIGRIQGKIPLDSFVKFTKTALTKVYEGEFGHGKLVKDRMLREKQDMELEEAIKQDCKRLIERKNKELLQIHEDKMNKAFVETFKSRIVPQSNSVKIKVRLPDGSSLQEIFFKTDTVGYLQEWLSVAHLLYPEMEGKCLRDFTLQLPYSENKQFKLLNTLEDVGLSPNGTVVVKLNK